MHSVTTGTAVSTPAEYMEMVKATVVAAARFAKDYFSSHSVGDVLKVILESVADLQRTVRGMTRPYFVYSDEINKRCAHMESYFDLLKNTIASDGTHDEAFFSIIQQAVVTIRGFPGWLVSTPLSYLVIPMEPYHNITEANDPPDRMQLSVDVRNCPRWILRRLLSAETDAINLAEQQQQERDNITRRVSTTEYERLKDKAEAQRRIILDLETKLQAAEGETMLAQHSTMLKQNQIVALEKTVQDLSEGNPIEAEQIRLDYEEQLSVAIETLHSEYQQRAQKAFEDKANEIQKYNQSDLARKEAEIAKKNAELARKEAELVKKDAELEEMKGHLSKLKDIAKHLRTDYYKLKKREQELLAKLDESQREVQRLVTTTSSRNPFSPRGLTSEVPYYDQTNSSRSDHFAEEDFLLGEPETVGVEFGVAKFWMQEKQRRECLIHLMLDRKMGFDFLKVIEKVFSSGAEAEQFVTNLLHLFTMQGREMELIFKMIEMECSNSPTHSTLFRGEEFPPRCLRVFTRMRGLSFAREVLGDLIQELINSNTCIQFDPDDGETLDEDSMRNQLNMHTQRFLDAILGSLSFFPLEFRQIANFLTKQASKRWSDPAAVQGAIAGFVFLRFFCPCIASPQNFGLPQPPPRVLKSLLLIGKVIQSLANGVSSFKEPHLKFMDPFLSKNKQAIEYFVRIVREWPPRYNGDENVVVELETQMCKPKHKEKMSSLISPNSSFSHFIDAKWECRTEIDPLSRLNSILSVISKKPQPLPQPSLHPAITRKATATGPPPPLFTEVVDRSKFPSDSCDPLVKALRLTYIDSDVAIATLTRHFINHSDNTEEVRRILPCLFTLFSENSSERFFITTMVITESSEMVSRRSFLTSGVTAQLFQFLSRDRLTPWLGRIWAPILMEIMSIDDASEDPQRLEQDKVVYLALKLLDACLFYLRDSPDVLWDICHAVTHTEDYLEVGSFEIFLVNCISKAIEDPQAFCLIKERPRPLHTQIFFMLSDALKSMALGDYGTNPLFTPDSPQLPERRTIFYNWVGAEAFSPGRDIYRESSWTVERSALLDLTDYILLRKSDIEFLLKGRGPICHNVSFFAREVIDSLEEPTTPHTPTYIHRQVPITTSTGSVSSKSPKEEKKNKLKQPKFNLKKTGK